MQRATETPTEVLFGVIALHNNLVAPGDVSAALAARRQEPNKTLSQVLVEQGALSCGQSALLESLSYEYIKRHGSAELSLASIVAAPASLERIHELNDPDVTACVVSRDSTLARDPAREGACALAGVPGPRFRVLRLHAKGGIGEVFVAHDAELNREVALKRIQERHADDPASRARFLLEAEVTGGLEHPGIVAVYGLGTYDGGRPYYAMRFIRGESLKVAIDRFHRAFPPAGAPLADKAASATSEAGPLGQASGSHSDRESGSRDLALRKLLRRFIDVCNATEYAHSRGVLHRDIKPGNIILGQHGETLLVDWGLAKATGRSHPSGPERSLSPSSASGTAETLPGLALGTPAYMSPEQAEGNLEALGPRSDVYCLGATLYCLLTGRPQVESDDVAAAIRTVRSGEFPRPGQLDPRIDRALQEICTKAMARRPEDRYVSCRALAEDVERWMAGEPVSAWREPLLRRARRWARLHRTAVSGALAAVLAGVVGLAAVAGVQARANVELRAANQRETARFQLALEAIESFHTGVTEDFLLKEGRFKTLRATLLHKAVDFYSRLEGLLKDQTDQLSRAALGRAYFELGRLTSQIGTQPEALAVHRQALAIRRELAAAPSASADALRDLAQSLRHVGLLQEATGDSPGAIASYEEGRRACEQTARFGPMPDPVAEVESAILLDLGWLQSQIGLPEQAWTSYQSCRSLRQQLARANPSAKEYRRELGNLDVALGILQADTGRTADALESYRRACAVLQPLADANPTTS
jgi:serine/threonine-protein kinase